MGWLADALERHGHLAVVPVGGRLPHPENVAAIRKALERVPTRFLVPWSEAAGRLELIAGNNATLHPEFSWCLRPAAGWNRGTFSVVAADAGDAERTTLHELGHAVDAALGFIADKPTWRGLWAWHKRCETIPAFARQRESPGEFFAECFANLWSGNGLYVPTDLQNYLAHQLPGIS